MEADLVMGRQEQKGPIYQKGEWKASHGQMPSLRAYRAQAVCKKKPNPPPQVGVGTGEGG